MKKNLILRAALMAALTLGLAASCAKEPVQTEEPEAPVNGTRPSVIQASIPEEITKVSLTPGEGGNGLALAWEAGDQLTVIGETTEQFTIAEGFTANKAEFTGNPVEGDSFTVIYPGQTYASAAAVNARTYTEQVQSGNANTDHLEWNAMLEGVADYSSLNFSGAGCRQNGALKFHLQLPEGFSTVEWVSLSAPDAIFSTSNDPASEKVNELRLTLQNVDVSESNRILTAYMMVSWNENVIAAGTELTIKVKGEQDEPWTKVKTVGEEGFTIAGGKVTSLKLNDSDWDEPMFWSGNGTESDPYTIKTVQHMRNMTAKIMEVAGASTLYFKLLNDLDFSGVDDWLYRNNSDGNIYPIDFDGNNKTIRNFSMKEYSASLFGVLIGSVHDLNFADAVIQTNSTNAAYGGLLAYSAGRKNDNYDAPVEVSNITVTGLTVTGTTSPVGGLFGRISNGTVNNCKITGLTLNGEGPVGGIAGKIYEGNVSFENCSVEGTVKSTGNQVGGLVGAVSNDAADESNFEGCSFKGDVEGFSIVGGLIGGEYANRIIKISDCHSEGSVKATGTMDNAGIASFVGGLIGIARYNLAVDGIIITQSWSSADVSGTGVVGGLVGEGVGLTLGSKSGDQVVEADACEYKNGTITGSAGADTNNAYMATVGGLVALPRGAYSTRIYGCKVSGATIDGSVYAGGIVGHNRKMDLEIEGCTVDSNTSITVSGNFIGGILASSASSTDGIKGNTVSATISGAQFVGGILGVLEANVSLGISKNTFNGILNSSSSNAGGIVGGANGDTAIGATLTITSCTSDGKITCAGQNVGGIIGRAKNKIVISLCKVGGSITSTTTSGNAYVAGIGANMLSGRIEKCLVNAVIQAGTSIVGGVVGSVYWGDVEVSECAFEGDLSTSSGTYVGGLAAHVNTSRTLTLHDSYSAGSITTSQGYAGGAVGVVIGNLVMDDCYTRNELKAGKGSTNSLGCLIAGSTNQAAQNNATYDVDQCLVWDDRVDFNQTAAYDGVMVGQVHQAATTAATSVTGCWYDYSLGDRYTTQHNPSRTPADQADLTSSPGKARYDGHRAAEGVTCQAKAIELGWSSDVWKLDNADGFPTLKNVAE